MKTPRFILSIAFSALILSSIYACAFSRVNGSKTMETTQFDIENFTGIVVSHAINVELVQADEFSVAVTHNDNLDEYLVVTKKGNDLIIKLKPGHSYRNTKVSAIVHLPQITNIEASGASNVTSQLLQAKELKVEVSGASNISAQLNVTKMVAHASGASNLKFKGTVDYLVCEASGASDLRASDLEVVSELRVQASGASNLKVTCNGEIYARLSGASDLVYFGSGTIVSQSVTGASSIKSKAL